MRIVAGLLGLACWLSAPFAFAGGLVFDPAPLNGARSSDFASGASGVNERYQFAGSARNDSDAVVHLTLAARAEHVDIPGSAQSFAVPAHAATPFQYDFTYANQPVPAQIGLDFASDGSLAFVAGVFTFAPAASVPALMTGGVPVLALLLGAVSAIAARRRSGAEA